MDNWDEIRTAYQVARMGTVSGAADVLGVHHATVIRHIDALESRLGVKLFQRHARGYTPTEAGQDLLRVAQGADDQFSQLAGRIKGRGQDVSGELVITSLPALAPLMLPVLADFRRDYPDVVVRYLTGERVFRLEYGEAHVAIRAGSAPQDPDNVVQPMLRQRIGLYAAASYVERKGVPQGPEEYPQHEFIGSDNRDTRVPFHRWLWDAVPPENIIFRSTDLRANSLAVLEGIGIGFLNRWEAEQHDGLVEICPPHDDWGSPLWLVTHMALHRTTKVQAFLNFLKDRAKGWN
ncbi:transcriptional regulator, LysR family [Thalassovita litoralis]|jgi:DNA-binding transcriptional LysR family regulator|uniref:Transcriptional regulator, LysR family n=1 Tax=Thalassovita litoralis TaxID=1010611 RepID=A0A521EHQ9_9RHOB|nr:LysR family transcriptional regulator [Thalassovita litoralis]SMO82710.1 transcriptional regulator, LysR family [Thalassovita litoralis]